jgi:hypothetical protein
MALAQMLSCAEVSALHLPSIAACRSPFSHTLGAVMLTLVPAFAVRDIILMFNPKAAGARGIIDIKTSL